MLLLELALQEPLPDHVLPQMTAEVGAVEAARRYRAVILTTLRRLQHLPQTRLLLRISPEEGEEAVRFWVLPKLAGSWERLGPRFCAPGWDIEFGSRTDREPFAVHASASLLCPSLGARWVHTACLGLGRSISRALGASPGGEPYLDAVASKPADGLPERLLPPLPLIESDADWQLALAGPLGPSLKRAWEQEA